MRIEGGSASQWDMLRSQLSTASLGETMRPDLTVVPGNLPEPPYPADTTFPGWAIEIDIDRLYQSKTWTLADNEVKPWLLRLWIEAWKSIPAGTFEADDAYLCARIGCKPEWFAGHRDNLMRGWQRHSDGLLYHCVITEQVQTMLGRRHAATERQRKRRSSVQSQVSHDVSHVTYRKDQDQDQDNKNLRPSGVCPIAAVQHTHDAANGTPYEAIRDLWIEVLPTLPRPIAVEFWTPARKTQLRVRWKEQLPDLGSWRKAFEKIRQSDFLMGRTERPFRCTLFWITKPENLLKLYEGHFYR